MTARAGTIDLPEKAVWPALTALVLVGAALRVFHLDNGLWYDEIVTLVESARPPLGEILTSFPGNNNHPLYSVLAHLSIAWFGEHAWSLRLPAVLFGIATIPMLYVFGAGVGTRLQAFAAAGMLAVSYHHIWFSQNARGYTALLFFALLATHLLLLGLRDRRRSIFVAYAAVSALGAYTHLTMVFLVVGHAAIIAVYALFFAGKRFAVRDWIDPALGFALAGLLTVLLYAPILLDVHAVFDKEPKGEQLATAGWALLAALRGLRIGFVTGWGAVLAGGLILVGCWSYFRQSPLVLALFVLPAPILLAAAMVLGHAIRPRFFFFLMGFGLLIAVRGAVATGGWAAGRMWPATRNARVAEFAPAVLVAAMIVLSAFALPYGYRFPKQDYGAALRFVEETRKDGDAVVVLGIGTAFPYRQYYGKPWPEIDSLARFNAIRAAHGAVWLLYTFSQYVERRHPELMQTLRASCARAMIARGTLADGNIQIYRCAA